MINTITQDLQQDEILLFFVQLIIVIGVFFLTWFVGIIIKYFVKKIPRLNPGVKNGVLVLITIVQFTLLISFTTVLLTNLEVQLEFIVGSLAILATAIGVASTGIATNFIGGLYILTTRPFKAGDYIITQGIEGIVEEIGMNFTSLNTIDRTIVKIPNGNLINSSLLNCTEIKENNEEFFISSSIFSSSKEFILYKKKIELNLNVIEPPIPIKSVKERLDQVCNEYADDFGTKPIYYLEQYRFRLEVYMIIRVEKGFNIFSAWPYFIESLMTTIYQELQEEISL